MREHYSQKKIRRDIAPQVFLVVGLLMSALLLSFVLQQMPARDAVQERISPDLAEILPAGATVASNEVEIPALPQSTYVVAFRAKGGTSLALVSWDRIEHRFALVSAFELSNGGEPVTEQVSITAESLGRGAPPAIIVRAIRPFESVAYHIVLREGNTMRYAARTDVSGTRSDARFYATGADTSGTGNGTFELGDVDGDGDKDAVEESASVTVYAWSDDGFFYDSELSRVLSLSKSIFPEPENPPTEPVMEIPALE